jgi:hypothetical protein
MLTPAEVAADLVRLTAAAVRAYTDTAGKRRNNPPAIGNNTASDIAAAEAIDAIELGESDRAAKLADRAATHCGEWSKFARYCRELCEAASDTAERIGDGDRSSAVLLKM